MTYKSSLNSAKDLCTHSEFTDLHIVTVSYALIHELFPGGTRHAKGNAEIWTDAAVWRGA
jgi:hypothetical protein